MDASDDRSTAQIIVLRFGKNARLLSNSYNASLGTCCSRSGDTWVGDLSQERDRKWGWEWEEQQINSVSRRHHKINAVKYEWYSKKYNIYTREGTTNTQENTV